jgi:AcrR family transcriptional regulator
MATKAPDRRVQRTRKLLQDALMTLILEKGYEAVTIQDIIDRANVGRSTFYAHFLDKQQLLLSGFEQLRVELAQQQHAAVDVSGERRLGFSLAMFEHACSYRPVWRALIGTQGGAVVRKQMQQMLTDLVREELAALAPRAAAQIPLEIVVQYTVSAFMGLLMWCADHDIPDTPTQIDAFYQQLTMPGVLAGLGLTDQLAQSDGSGALL